MLLAGQLRDRITIQANDDTAENAAGEPIPGWSDLFSVLAQVTYRSARESRQAAAEGAEQTATFRVRRSKRTLAITPRHRVRFKGADWDITDVAEYDRMEVRLTATRRT